MHSAVQTAIVTIISYKPLSGLNFARYTGLWSLICVRIQLSSYDGNQIVWLSVFNDCQDAAFHVVLNYPCLVCVSAGSRCDIQLGCQDSAFYLILSLVINLHLGS